MHGAESPASVRRIYLFLASFAKVKKSQGRKARVRGGNKMRNVISSEAPKRN